MALIQCIECGKNISDTTDECIHCGKKLDDETFNESDTTMNISEIVASGLRPMLEVIFGSLLTVGFIFLVVDEEYSIFAKIVAIVIYYSVLVLIFGLTFLIINTSKTINEMNMTLEDILNRMKQ